MKVISILECRFKPDHIDAGMDGPPQTGWSHAT